MSGQPEGASAPQQSARDLLLECVLYGIFFKAVAVDLATLRPLSLKLSYLPVLEEMSIWAERLHHQLKRQLLRQGVEILTARKQGKFYTVQIRIKGYRQEAVYSIELLHAECQERLRGWLVRNREQQLAKGGD
ncbi:UNVERIFIED_CONTAM: hypothetical protein ABID98_000870 [Brevibacillus sp. OAP136]